MRHRPHVRSSATSPKGPGRPFRLRTRSPHGPSCAIWRPWCRRTGTGKRQAKSPGPRSIMPRPSSGIQREAGAELGRRWRRGTHMEHFVAYLDPGSGSLIIQVAIASIVAIPFFLRTQVMRGITALRSQLGHSRIRGVGQLRGSLSRSSLARRFATRGPTATRAASSFVATAGCCARSTPRSRSTGIASRQAASWLSRFDASRLIPFDLESLGPRCRARHRPRGHRARGDRLRLLPVRVDVRAAPGCRASDDRPRDRGARGRLHPQGRVPVQHPIPEGPADPHRHAVVRDRGAGRAVAGVRSVSAGSSSPRSP